jgi:hypothetical protein
MNDNIITTLIFALFIGIALGAFAGEIIKLLSPIYNKWRFRHRVLEVYTPTIKKKEK